MPRRPRVAIWKGFSTNSFRKNQDFEHDDEGPDDMPSHIRMALTRTSETIPIVDGKMQLGTWQGIFLFEHRRDPHRRKISLTIIGE